MNRPTLPSVLLAIGLAVTVLFIVDCSSGNTVHDEAIVNGRYYKPPWTEITVNCDEDGCTFGTEDHPEEWHTTVEMVGTGTIKDFNAGKTYYLTLTNGQFVTIRSKQGRWTGIKYIGTIEP